MTWLMSVGKSVVDKRTETINYRIVALYLYTFYDKIKMERLLHNLFVLL